VAASEENGGIVDLGRTRWRRCLMHSCHRFMTMNALIRLLGKGDAFYVDSVNDCRDCIPAY
jgi:predicted metal-dependent hydrolase